MRSRKACAVIMAPNIEQDEDEGRLDGLLAGLLGQAASYGIPVLYALSRKKLGLVRLTCPSESMQGSKPSPSCTRCRARSWAWCAPQPRSVCYVLFQALITGGHPEA